MSHLLFNISLNNLPSMFKNIASDPLILPNKTKLNCLLYADDLVILSRSKIGLQNCLDQLNNRCKQWLMQINLKKRKIIVLQKSNKKQLIEPTQIQHRRHNTTIYPRIYLSRIKTYTYREIYFSHEGRKGITCYVCCKKKSEFP